MGTRLKYKVNEGTYSQKDHLETEDSTSQTRIHAEIHATAPTKRRRRSRHT